MSELSGHSVDLAVVGGGPVGLAAALEAARCGLSVTIVEPRAAPVDKACGEGLFPGTLAAVQRLGVDPAGAPLTGIRYLGPRGHVADVAFPSAGRGVRRTALTLALAQAARRAGADRVPGRVVALAQDGAGVELTVAPVAGQGVHVPATLRARWVIAADGLHSPVRSLLGLHATTDGLRYGVRRHAAVAPWTDRVEVHWGPRVEVYVTPVAAGEVGVAVLGRRGDAAAPGSRSPDDPLGQVPQLAERLAGAVWTTSARGAGPLRQRVPARACGRVLLAGDAAGYVDALTGEGLRVGLDAARAAVAEVTRAVRGPLDRSDDVEAVGRAYEHRWRALTRRYRLLTSALVAGTRPAVGRALIVPAAAAAPPAFGAVVRALSL